MKVQRLTISSARNTTQGDRTIDIPVGAEVLSAEVDGLGEHATVTYLTREEVEVDDDTT